MPCNKFLHIGQTEINASAYLHKRDLVSFPPPAGGALACMEQLQKLFVRNKDKPGVTLIHTTAVAHSLEFRCIVVNVELVLVFHN